MPPPPPAGETHPKFGPVPPFFFLFFPAVIISAIAPASAKISVSAAPTRSTRSARPAASAERSHAQSPRWGRNGHGHVQRGGRRQRQFLHDAVVVKGHDALLFIDHGDFKCIRPLAFA